MTKARRREHQNLEMPIIDSSDNKAFISHSLSCGVEGSKEERSISKLETPRTGSQTETCLVMRLPPCVSCLCVESETERACKVIKAPSHCRLMGELLHFTAV